MTEHPKYGVITIRGFYGWGNRPLHEDNEPNKPGGFIVEWSASKYGFGEIAFYEKDGKLLRDDECMSDDFVDAVMAQFSKQVSSNR